jgi:predicted aldo/keto reductase-like oxidoreductase
VKTNTETELEIAGRFIQSGYTDAQAKLKAVWENPNIASICSEMPNMTILMANAAAAMNKTKLSSRDMNLLHQYAQETHSDYCAGCTEICESTINGQVPIGDVMRYLMYCRSYGNRYQAIALFKEIPEDVRAKIASLDYSLAEKRCPQKMAIAKLMRDALEELS